MLLSVPNPIRFLVSSVGFVLSSLGIIDRQRARRTTDLAWPRIVTGIARMSKNAVDVAMVGIAVGSAGIAGVGFAGPFWGLAFSIGGGLAAGTIAIISLALVLTWLACFALGRWSGRRGGGSRHPTMGLGRPPTRARPAALPEGAIVPSLARRGGAR